MLCIQNLTVRRGAREVVTSASLNVTAGEFVGLIGPNGAGKTSLMRAAMGLIPATGECNLARLSPTKRALIAAWMPQSREVVWPVSVETLVRLGRIPHQSPDADHAAVEAALRRMNIAAFRDRPVSQLSGGEQARVLIARTLAQETPLLMADEPIAGLDPAHQIGAMQTFRDLADEGRCVIASLHDLGLAARHCTRLVMMDAGRIVADGVPAEVLTPDLLARVFGVSGYFAETPDGPIFQPLRVLE
ncbi:MAG: ABC transporter ATP-binding protein [Paracoccus sp. (in: a-proteobacteria)]|uniref:ABC transporter ATP-binding protein n=1 Tax=Paracoccus sp. TaxID=267 RepID=UPI0026DEB7BB|nr:ABC transporter ATP-binding protein [Paracoccus sp. (in: a-proteobacteria)]MDO5622792.1 ABC transporter ATP-binding protein [Paracoccus sp. (in: a-proteobacteria)]